MDTNDISRLSIQTLPQNVPYKCYSKPATRYKRRVFRCLLVHLGLLNTFVSLKKHEVELTGTTLVKIKLSSSHPTETSHKTKIPCIGSPKGSGEQGKQRHLFQKNRGTAMLILGDRETKVVFKLTKHPIVMRIECKTLCVA